MIAPERSDERRPLVLSLMALFAGGLLIRLLFAVVVLPDGGHQSDLALLTQWARELAANGPGAFYRPESGYFADYPPVYLYVLWLTGMAGRAWSAAFGGGDVTPLMIKVPFMLADLGVAAVLYLLARRLFGQRAGLVAAAVFLFNPAVILVSTVWGQNDSIATLAVVIAIYLLVTGRTEAAAAVGVLAMLIKFQYGFVIPIVAIVGLRRHLLGLPDGDGATWPRDPRRIGLALLAGASTLILVCVPFGLRLFDPSDPAHSLVDRFIAASRAFPGVTQNAFNLWMNPFFDVVIRGASGATEGHVVDDTAVAFAIGGVALTWQWVGNLLFIAAVLVALSVLIRRADGVAIVFVALVIAVAFFALPTRVHERYLYPALALGLPLLAAGPDWRRLYVAVSAIAFFDVYWVYSLPGANDGPGRGALGETIYSPAGIYLLSAVTVAVMGVLAFRALRPAGLPWALAGGGMTADTAGPPPDEPATDVPVPPRPSRPLAELTERAAVAIRAWRPPATRGTIAALVLISFVAAILVARIHGPAGPWLWNLDLPKIDFPLASFFHDALREGRLPLWNDHLGLGYPLYAEGQIGAFYPPNWLLFQFPPLIALDLSRVLHLTMAGTGAGTLVLVLAGSRSGAVLAALVAVFGGAIAAKLEWHNLVAAYAYLPWVLVPLVRRPHPTRGGLVAAGLLLGIQAWTGHPNTWLLTALAAAVVMLATAPRVATLGRIVGLGLLGGAVGAVQLVPTAILTTLSVRSEALSPTDLFASASTPFDILSFGFQNAFVRVTDGAWRSSTTWYPDGPFALFEASAYVGLAVLALAAVGIRTRRARPFVALALVCLAIPIIAAFRPEIWTQVPILNGLRSPTRSYVVVTLALAVLAGIGVGRLGRSRGAARRAAIAVVIPVAAYALTTWLAVAVPNVFDRLLLGASSFLGEAGVAAQRELAVAALTTPWPLLLEIVAGMTAVYVVARADRWPAARLALGPLAVGVAAIPLILLGPQPNPARQLSDFSYADGDYIRAVAATDPGRLFAVDPSGFYAGSPDQLAAARLPDLRMFSSLDLLASDRLIDRLTDDDPDGALRRAVGVDVLVTFERPCPGRPLAVVAAEEATICRDDAALRPPYWIPEDAVRLASAGDASLIRPHDAEMDAGRTIATAVEQTPSSRDPGTLTVDVDAPAAGWLWIDRAWWPAWRTTVDGRPVDAARALAGQLVPVPAGASVVRQAFVPWDALLGLAVGVVATIAALAWAFGPRARRPRLRGSSG